MHIAIVGATGLVGRTMARVLEERSFPVTTLRLLASHRSAGERVNVLGSDYIVQALGPASFEGIDVALFSAGGSVSKEYCPIAARSGAVAIDNSSAWRMDPDVPLVVPEVNPEDVRLHHGIIANPNCSTIQLVVALKPLHDAAGIKRVVCSTYQSVSGAGQKGVDQLRDEIQERTPTSRISAHTLAYNAVFHTIDGMGQGSEEEIKMQRETRRILHLPNLPIAVTCVRVPVLGGHGEAVALEFERALSADDAREILRHTPGIVVMDDPANNVYPSPRGAANTDPVYVGRIRQDTSVANGILLWVVADNLRKGAATNAVQIAELL